MSTELIEGGGRLHVLVRHVGPPLHTPPLHVYSAADPTKPDAHVAVHVPLDAKGEADDTVLHGEEPAV